MKHIHDYTAEDATCACGYRSTSTPRPRTAEDIIDDIVSCADYDDGGPDDARQMANELYLLAFQDGLKSPLAVSDLALIEACDARFGSLTLYGRGSVHLILEQLKSYVEEGLPVPPHVHP